METQLPHNTEAERALLGILLMHQDELYTVSSSLRPEHFYHARHQSIYEAILEIDRREMEINPITVEDWLAPAAAPDDGWLSYLIDLVNSTPGYFADDYAAIVTEKALRRRLVDAGGRIAAAAWDEKAAINEVIQKSETALFNARQSIGNEQAARPREYTSDYIDRFNRLRENGHGEIGLLTGFIDLDRILSGFQQGYQYVLAARPGKGKSALAVNIATHAVLNLNKRVGLFSLEMSKIQIQNRIASSMTGIPSQKIQKPWLLSHQETQQVYEVIGRLSDNLLLIDDAPGLSAADIRSRSMRWHNEYGLDLIIVDHLHIMRPTRDFRNPALEYGEMTTELANLYKSLNVPGLTVAQLSRSVESRQNKKPLLSDLRESGRIEENAYAVMFLYRAHYYDDTADPHVADLIIAKHREGDTGEIQLYWKPEIVAFRNLQRQEIHLPQANGKMNGHYERVKAGGALSDAPLGATRRAESWSR